MTKYIVITSVNDVTEGVRRFAGIKDWQVILVGDRKSPALERHPYPNITFLSIKDQEKLCFKSYNTCPFDHYSRKNLGYLYAIKHNAELIADTDDDNIPYEYWGENIINQPDSIEVVSSVKLINIYRFFIDQFIWPRGFPLSAVRVSNEREYKVGMKGDQKITIWQGLADHDPDVDAIYRLIIGKSIKFKKRDPIALNQGVYCPFNSQNTIWAKEAFPFLYLPAHVSFRFTDILRGYIAQRGLWAMNTKLAFTSASVWQKRNAHDYMLDFIDEIPCYTQVDQVIDLLDRADLNNNPYDNLRTMYEIMLKGKIVKQIELDGVRAWIEDMNKYF